MSRIIAKGTHPQHGGEVTLIMGFDQMLFHDHEDGYFFEVRDPKAVIDDPIHPNYNEQGVILEAGGNGTGISTEDYYYFVQQWQCHSERVVQPERYRTKGMDLRGEVPCFECIGQRKRPGYLVRDTHDVRDPKHRELRCSHHECGEEFYLKEEGVYVYKNMQP